MRRSPVARRAKGRCEYCLAPEEVCAYTFHVEHIIPRSRGVSVCLFVFMLTSEQIKEELSYAYLHAVASHAGFSCEHGPRKDMDSVDAQVLARGRLVADSTRFSPRLEFQLKATAVAAPTGTHFSFALPMKNYNDLRQPRVVPVYLIVFTLPENAADWLALDEEALVTRRCAYWCSLLGAPEVANTDSRTVRLPRNQCLTPDALTELMVYASREEDLPYVA